MHGNAFPVAFADETPFPRHHECGGEAFRGLERRVDRRLHFLRVELGREGVIGKDVSHRPWRHRRIGKVGFDLDRGEVDAVFAFGKRDASLVPVVLRGTDDAVG